VNYEPGTMFGNFAVAHGTAEETVVTGGGKRFEFASRWMANLIKEDGPGSSTVSSRRLTRGQRLCP